MLFKNAAFDIEYSMEPGHSTGVVQGTLCNRLDRHFGTVLLSFHFYDGENFRIGQEQIFVTDVAPCEKVRFTGAINILATEIADVKLVRVDLVPASDNADLLMDELAEES